MLQRIIIITTFCFTSLFAVSEISIKGIVTDGTVGIEGAKVSLVKEKNVSEVTNSNGEFFLKALAVRLTPSSIQNIIKFEMKANLLCFSIASKINNGYIELFSSNGRRLESISLNNPGNGDFHLPQLSAGCYIVQINIDGLKATYKLISTENEVYIGSQRQQNSAGDKGIKLLGVAATVVDTIKVEKAGYKTAMVAIDSYTKEDMIITLTPEVLEAKEAGCVTALAASSPSSYTANTKLPDPFKMKDGTRMTQKSQWCEQRAYLSSLLQATTFGEKPPKPEKVTATLKNNTISITCEEKGKSISFNISITVPSSGKAPYPGYIALGGSTFGHFGATPAGCARINYMHNEIAQQSNTSSRGKGKFYDLYGSTHSAGAMMAWAWGVSRILDALELLPEAKIDPLHCSVIGCSRDGKGAMVCGAFDERIALVLPMEGGSGGISSWRIADVENKNKSAHPDGCQTASQIIGENAWLSPNFDQFARNNNLNKLPVDAHTLAAICAPRGIFMVEGSKNSWNCNTCCWTSASAAQTVFEFLGVKDNIGITMYNHGHCSGTTAQDKEAYNAFVKRFLFGDTSVKTNFFKNDGSFDKLNDFTKWIDWSMPR